MLQAADNNTLSDRHYITLILRLTLNRAGDLVQGDLVDTTNELPKHFIGATGLHKVVEAWLWKQHSEDRQKPHDRAE